MFVYVMKLGVQFHIFLYGQLFYHHLLTGLILFLQFEMLTSVIYSTSICIWMCFWSLYSITLVVVYCASLPHVLIAITLENILISGFTFFIFNNVDAILGPLLFHISFRISLFGYIYKYAHVHTHTHIPLLEFWLQLYLIYRLIWGRSIYDVTFSVPWILYMSSFLRFSLMSFNKV